MIDIYLEYILSLIALLVETLGQDSGLPKPGYIELC